MNNAIRIALFSLLPLSLSACQTVMEQPSMTIGHAQLSQRDGNPAGTARLYESAGELTISVALDGLSPGVHAVHLHTSGDCSASDFTSAGGHLNPQGKQHGRLNPAGAHLGDLPNATLDSQGKGSVSAILDLKPGEAEAVLFDADGTAVVVHEGPDDYRSDPAGAAGSRVACGRLVRD